MGASIEEGRVARHAAMSRRSWRSFLADRYLGSLHLLLPLQTHHAVRRTGECCRAMLNQPISSNATMARTT